jgi:hypothetical protein
MRTWYGQREDEDLGDLPSLSGDEGGLDEGGLDDGCSGDEELLVALDEMYG